MFKKIITNAVASTSIILFSNSAFANNYPEKEIKLHIGFHKNQISEKIAQIFAQGFKKVSGEHVHIISEPQKENNHILDNSIALSTPDGYTLALANTSSLISSSKDNKNILDKLSIVSNFATTPNIILISNSFPAKDFKGFENEIKRAKGKYIFSSYGRGTISHLIMESFKEHANLDILHLPYGKHSQAINDVVLNKIDGTFTNYVVANSLIKEGKVKPLAVSGNERLANLPDVPTLKELGYPQVNKMSYFSIIGPPNLPTETIDRVSKIIEQVTKDPDVIKELNNIGAQPEYIDEKRIKKILEDDLKFYQEVQGK